MTAAVLLDRLRVVRRTGPGRWVALCPAHEDRRPSLAVRELDDGRVLIHCFAGCAAEEVLSAVGLGFDALYPESTASTPRRAEARPFPAADVLRCVAFEAGLVAIAAARLARGDALADADRDRLLTAATRLQVAAWESGHR